MVSDLKASLQSGDKEVKKMSVSFGVEGQGVSAYNFISRLGSSFPLNRITKTQVENTGDTQRFSINLEIYYAESPTKLPSIDSPITELDSQDQEILRMLAEYEVPPSLTIDNLAPSDAGRPDPFN